MNFRRIFTPGTEAYVGFTFLIAGISLYLLLHGLGTPPLWASLATVVAETFAFTEYSSRSQSPTFNTSVVN